MGWGSNGFRLALLFICGGLSARGYAQSERPPQSVDEQRLPDHAPDHARWKRATKLAASITTLIALNKGHGRGNYASPFYAAVSRKPRSSNVNLCHVEPISIPSHCVSPGPKPVPPKSNRPVAGCKLCSETAKDQAWDAYIAKQLATEALQHLLLLHEALEYFGPPGPIADAIAKALDASQDDSLKTRAVRHTLRTLLATQSPKAKSKEMERLLQVVLDATGQQLLAEDLSTEGGLKAAAKLAHATAKTARVHWQAQFAAWATCRRTAVDAQQLASPEESEVERCKNGTPGDPEAEQAWNAVLGWQRKQDNYQICLESNRPLTVVAATYQSAACAPASP